MTDNAAAPKPKKMLQLTIEVDGVWADDLEESADGFFAGDMLATVLDDEAFGLDEQVGLTVLVRGDEAGPFVHAYTCRIVGAAVRERGPSGD